jgi:hypothetical protein
LPKLTTFIDIANNEWSQYLAAIESLVVSNRSRIELEKRKSEHLLDKQVSDISSQLDQLDQVYRIFKAQNLSTKNLDKIRMSIEVLGNVLTKDQKREFEDETTRLTEQVQSEIAKLKEKISVLREKKNREFHFLLNSFEEIFAKFEQSSLTKNLENSVALNLNFDSVLPDVGFLRVSDKIHTFSLLGDTVSFRVPQITGFAGKQCLTLIYDPGFNIKEKIHELIIRLLLCAEAGNVKFVFIDNHSNGEDFLDFLKLNEDLYSDKLITRVIDLESKLVELDHYMSNIYQGKLSSYAHISDYNCDNPKDIQPFHFLFFNNFPSGISSNSVSLLDKILRLGPKAGIHVIFVAHSNNVANNPYKLLEKTFQYTFNQDDYLLPTVVKENLKREVLALCEKRYNPDENLYFEEHCIAEPDFWTKSSIREVEIPLGLRLNKEVALKFDNALRKHAMLTGESGSGKSVLLHTIIMNVCINYAPSEVELWMADFKSGVEFKIYADYNLPHVKILALQSDEEVGLHILKLLRTEIQKRGELFKEAEVSNYADFRKKNPKTHFPRIMLIVDEYQRLYQNTIVKQVATDIIDYIASEGRAFGVNILFSSQSVLLDGRAANNVSTRIVLRTSLGRQALESGSDSAISLKVGEGILNEFSGAMGKDIKFRSFFLRKEPYQVTLLQQLSEKQKELPVRNDKFVFNGEARADLLQVNLVNHPEGAPGDELQFVPGEKILMDSNDYITSFIRQPNNNLLVVGGQSYDPSIRSLYGSFLSLLPQIDKNKARIFILNYINNGFREHYSRVRELASALEKSGYHVVYSETGNDTESVLADVENHVEQAKTTSAQNEAKTSGILLVFNIENNRNLLETEEKDHLGRTRSVKSPASLKLLSILTSAPDYGFYTMVQANSPDGYYKIFGDMDLICFRHRIALQMSNDDSRKFVKDTYLASGLYNAEIGDASINRSCYFDNLRSGMSAKLKPFEFLDLQKLEQFLSELNKK